jgi:long-chain acyl-CoA synthetase
MKNEQFAMSNDSGRKELAMNTINDLLAKNLIEIPAKPALVHGQRVVTYRDLAAQVNQVAGALDGLHGLPGNRVAILLRNCPEFLFTYFGAAASGNVAVPINYLLQPEEIAYILNNSQASCLVTSADLLPKIAAVKDRVPALRTVIVVGDNSVLPTALPWEQFLAGQPALYVPRRPALADDVVVFLYTSGTTGFPKGAMCTHRNLLNNVATEAELYGLGRADVFSCVLPMFHNYSLVDTCLLPIWYGATTVIGELDNTEELLGLIEKHHITFLATMPAQLSEMVSLEFWRTYDTGSLRMVQTGGAPLPTEVQRKFQAKYGLPIIEGYGCSEASSTVTVMPMGGPYKPLSVGKVMPNQRIRIVDEKGHDVPAGCEGEVLVQGPNVCQGYYGMPAESRHTLRGGWLHTGDLGKLDEEGFLYITGRLKSMINVGGFKVYPAEVEDVLYQVDGVVEACVVASYHPRFGETVKAFIEAPEGRRPNAEKVIRHCEERLGGYKVPRLIEFRSALPRTGTGKIAAKVLQAEELRRNTLPAA